MSRTALVRYLANHAEIPTKTAGPGHPVFVDFASLKAHRAAAANRKQMTAAIAPPARPQPIVDEFTARSRSAKIEREEHDARTARVRADEAEGRVVQKSDALAAFAAVGAVLAQWFDGNRRVIVTKIREAADQRSAEMLMRNQIEAEFRAAAVRELTKLMSVTPEAVAAE